MGNSIITAEKFEDEDDSKRVETSNTNSVLTALPTVETQPIVNKAFDDFTKILSEWH